MAIRFGDGTEVSRKGLDYVGLRLLIEKLEKASFSSIKSWRFYAEYNKNELDRPRNLSVDLSILVCWDGYRVDCSGTVGFGNSNLSGEGLADGIFIIY